MWALVNFRKFHEKKKKIWGISLAHFLAERKKFQKQVFRNLAILITYYLYDSEQIPLHLSVLLCDTRIVRPRLPDCRIKQMNAHKIPWKCEKNSTHVSHFYHHPHCLSCYLQKKKKIIFKVVCNVGFLLHLPKFWMPQWAQNTSCG